MAAALPAIQAIGTVLGGISAVKSLTADRPKPEPAPKPSEPEVMPARGDDASRRAGQRRLQQVRQRSGRLSTVLSDRDKLGAG